MVQPNDDNLQTLSTEILAGMNEWRSQHPKATLREMEAEVDLRLARLRARMLQRAAQTSTARDWTAQPVAQQPHCPDCQQPLTQRGLHTRKLKSHQDQAVTITSQYGTCTRFMRRSWASWH